MALDFDSKKALFGFALLALLISIPTPGLAAESASAPALESETAEKQACEVNLNLIFDAIHEYRSAHRDCLPARLSDLVPEFIADPKTLICPVERQTWSLRSWSKSLRDLSSIRILLIPTNSTLQSYPIPYGGACRNGPGVN
jgi:hypothetical protein